MRILFCQTTPHLPEATGGVESTVDALCRRLRAQGTAAEVLASLRRDGPMLRRLALTATLRGGNRIRVDRQLGYPVHRARDPLAALASLCRSGEPPVVVAASGAVFDLCRTAIEAGAPAIAYVHHTVLEDLGTPFAHARLAHAASSRFMAELLRDRLGIEAAVLPPLVEPQSYRTETSRRVVTFVNPIPRKGVEIAFALAARRPDIPFEFVEAWILRNRVVRLLQARAAHHGNVRLLRRVGDMRGVYARSRLVLMPSLCEESWGRVATEAQASGIPALAAARGGLPEAVGAGGILLDRAASPAEWEAALARIWDDPAEYARLSRAASEHAARPEIRPDAILARFLEFARTHAEAAAP